jgi:hypothetical protein
MATIDAQVEANLGRSRTAVELIMSIPGIKNFWAGVNFLPACRGKFSRTRTAEWISVFDMRPSTLVDSTLVDFFCTFASKPCVRMHKRHILTSGEVNKRAGPSVELAQCSAQQMASRLCRARLSEGGAS